MAQAARPMCLEWDSNPHCTDFEAVSSTSWDTEASFATELSFSVAARFPGRQRLPPIHHNIAISWRRPAASPFARSGAGKTFPATAGNREPMATPADGLQTPAARPDTTRKARAHAHGNPPSVRSLAVPRLSMRNPAPRSSTPGVSRPRSPCCGHGISAASPAYHPRETRRPARDAAGARRRPARHGRAVSRSDAPLDPGDSLRPCERRRRSGRRRG